jgi:hypothetical protein
MVRTGAPNDAVELIVVDAAGEIIPRPGAHEGYLDLRYVRALPSLNLPLLPPPNWSTPSTRRRRIRPTVGRTHIA